MWRTVQVEIRASLTTALFTRPGVRPARFWLSGCLASYRTSLPWNSFLDLFFSPNHFAACLVLAIWARLLSTKHQELEPVAIITTSVDIRLGSLHEHRPLPQEWLLQVCYNTTSQYVILQYIRKSLMQGSTSRDRDALSTSASTFTVSRINWLTNAYNLESSPTRSRHTCWIQRSCRRSYVPHALPCFPTTRPRLCASFPRRQNSSSYADDALRPSCHSSPLESRTCTSAPA